MKEFLKNRSNNSIHIGILCAMPEEIGSTLDNLSDITKTTYGDLDVFSGKWNKPNVKNFDLDKYLSVAWSGWGKVSSARAATRIIGHKINGFSTDILFFTGVAGAVNKALKQWDIILPNELIQHDMDARPIFEKYEIPALRRVKIVNNKKILNWTYKSLVEALEKGNMKNFGTISKGLIATGDRFVSDKKEVEHISRDIEGLQAVEMEGASVAQVATQERVPFQVIRVISDGANESSEDDFSRFLSKYNKCSAKIISALMNNMHNFPL